MGNVEEDFVAEQLFTLSSLRNRLGLTIEDVSKFTGFSVYKLMKYEEDSTDLPMDMAKIFAELYCVPFQSIFFGKRLTLSYELRKKGGYM